MKPKPNLDSAYSNKQGGRGEALAAYALVGRASRTKREYGSTSTTSRNDRNAAQCFAAVTNLTHNLINSPKLEYHKSYSFY